MIPDDPSRQLIERLAVDLEPVRPIAPLHVSFAAVMLAALAVGGGTLVLAGPRPGLWTSLAHDLAWAGVLLGLAAGIAGGCLGALASVVPGREAVVRIGVGIAGVGLAVAAGASAPAVWRGGNAAGGIVWGDLLCVVRGAGFAALPAAAVLYVASRGWAGRPGRTAALALVGAGGVGALVVHLSCPAVAPLHLLCAHACTPLLLAAGLTALLLPAVRALAR